MKRTFLIGVAAGALLAGANFASAQTMERSGGAGVEQKGSGGSVEQRGRAGGEIKAQSPAGDAKAQGQAQGDMKATTGQSQPKQDAQKSDSKAQDSKAKDAQSKPDASKSGATAQGEKSGGATTGQGAAGGAKASLSTEQRTRIRDTVIRSGNAPRVSNVNFSLSVGTAVPRTVRFAPLPPLLVEVYPQWRGFHYIIVEEQIVIIEPSSFKIVAVVTV